ncbi:MAG: hypothetical protein HYZ49_10630 [Chloroflexi bacterium]|nr:hypothetical protein [Chloroflexota bacterium]
MSHKRKLIAGIAVVIVILAIVPASLVYRSRQNFMPPINAVISVERTLCSGICSTSLLTIHGDGRATFEGKANSIIEGVRKTTLSRDKIEELLKAVEEMHFFALQDSYFDPTANARLITVAVTVDGRSKSIFHYGSCSSSDRKIAPSELCALETTINDIANSQPWAQDQSHARASDPVVQAAAKLKVLVYEVCPHCFNP